MVFAPEAVSIRRNLHTLRAFVPVIWHRNLDIRWPNFCNSVATRGWVAAQLLQAESAGKWTTDVGEGTGEQDVGMEGFGSSNNVAQGGTANVLNCRNGNGC